MAESTSRYHLLAPRESEETQRDSSPHSHLLASSNFSLRHFPTTYKITINPTITIRLISTILAITSFVILVLHGHDAFIAADIFLMLIIILNSLLFLHYCVSHIFKVTVELPRSGSTHTVGTKEKPKMALYFDVAFSACSLICLLIGNAVSSDRRWDWDNIWHDGVIVGYTVIGLQVLLAVPGLDRKGVNLSAKLVDLKGKPTPDTKLPFVAEDDERGPARRRVTPNTEEQDQSAEALV